VEDQVSKDEGDDRHNSISYDFSRFHYLSVFGLFDIIKFAPRVSRCVASVIWIKNSTLRFNTGIACLRQEGCPAGAGHPSPG
jgi:hypothetical protein